MATVVGVTAERATQIEDKIIIGATRSGTSLIFTTDGAGTINVPNAFPALFESYPIGSVYMTDRSANPSSYMGGGTWARWGKGRVPVSLDEAQVEFAVLEGVAGAKYHTLSSAEMPSHTHVHNPHSHNPRNNNPDASPSANVVGTDAASAAAGSNFFVAMGYTGYLSIDPTLTTEQATGGGQSHNNLQPYINVYMWKRTA